MSTAESVNQVDKRILFLENARNSTNGRDDPWSVKLREMVESELQLIKGNSNGHDGSALNERFAEEAFAMQPSIDHIAELDREHVTSAPLPAAHIEPVPTGDWVENVDPEQIITPDMEEAILAAERQVNSLRPYEIKIRGTYGEPKNFGIDFGKINPDFLKVIAAEIREGRLNKHIDSVPQSSLDLILNSHPKPIVLSGLLSKADIALINLLKITTQEWNSIGPNPLIINPEQVRRISFDGIELKSLKGLDISELEFPGIEIDAGNQLPSLSNLKPSATPRRTLDGMLARRAIGIENLHRRLRLVVFNPHKGETPLKVSAVASNIQALNGFRGTVVINDDNMAKILGEIKFSSIYDSPHFIFPDIQTARKFKTKNPAFRVYHRESDQITLTTSGSSNLRTKLAKTLGNLIQNLSQSA